MRVGVLALQGDYDAHAKALRAAACGLDPRRAHRAPGELEELDVRLVRRPADLEGLAGLILPGGESTTMLKLLALDGLDAAIGSFVGAGGAVLATCAGAILLSREVENPRQASLGLLDAKVERNSYGRQVDSFVARLAEHSLGGEPLEAVFIRAPRFRALGPEVEVLAREGGDPVLVRQGRVIAATFHPELTEDLRVHALFLRVAAEASAPHRVAASGA